MHASRTDISPPLDLADLRALLRAGTDPCIYLRPDAPDYQIVDATDVYLAAAGRTREEVVGRGFFETFFSESEGHASRCGWTARSLRASLERVIATGQPDSAAVQRYDAPGAEGRLVERYWRPTQRPVYGADGELAYLVHQVEDVTDVFGPALRLEMAAQDAPGPAGPEGRIRAEEIRSRTHAQLRRVVEQAPVAIAVLRGPELVFEVANARYEELVGKRVVIGQTFPEMFPELAGTGIWENLDQVFATGRPHFEHEHRIRLDRDTGIEEGVFNYVIEAVLDEQGRPEGVAVVAIDVTDLVRAREAAERLAAAQDAQRRQFETVLEQSPLAIAIVEAPSGRILFANRVFGRLFGPVSVEAITRTYSEHYVGFHADGRRVQSEEWPAARAILGGELVDGEVLQIQAPDGRRQAISCYAAPVRDAEGGIVAGVAMFRDVTEERRAEQQLRDTQRLQAVATLAGGVAHEINNQMTAVLGFGAFVLGALGAEHPQAADMRLVLQSAERASRISQQLLAFTRQQVTQPRLLDLHEVVTDLRPVLQRLLGADKVLALDLRDRGITVRADPDQVQQVLINLVANARDATETGAEIRLTLESVEVTREISAPPGEPVAPGRYVRLAVTDRGHGMGPDTLARIFDPFFTTKAVGAGAGLGLPMVFGTLRRHGGYVVARSAPGAGTTMELYWPVALAEAAASAGESEAPPPQTRSAGNAAMVLVVEDESIVRTLAVRTLEVEGYRVIAGEDGAAALEALERDGVRPDLVVTDMLMPRMNGRQLYDALRARWPELPVLFMSGHTGEGEVLQRLVPAGAPFLPKPFTPDALARAVADLRARQPGSMIHART